ncbi:PAS domain S-box-containing protein [Amaricoccus macauensis]|uniref:histidine kinase n=1 Tax=Amaricoccus macauensis TaxID=57001 RepID=A0A840SS92_9RHOB|nr:HWE histidine kinase domain-containing protein [Amaricoccus macauensis]MBB5222696.1 PAS domain S-box-containing protein [Amaricoccus macauensis]
MNLAELAPGFVAVCAIVIVASLAHPHGRRALGAGALPIGGILVASAIMHTAGHHPSGAGTAALLGIASAGLWLVTLARLPDQRAADAARRETELSDRRFREALARSNITVFAQDTDLRYTWMYNPRLGVSAESVLGRTANELVEPDLLSEADALKRKAIEAGLTVNDTVALHTPEEGRLYFDMTVVPTFDAAGEIDGILCSAFDVTEMRLFEVRLTAMAAQLATAYQRFELALDDSPITVFEQGPGLRYTFVYNPPPGLTATDFLDRTDAEIFSERDAHRLQGPKQRVLTSGGRETVEIEVEVAGTVRYYELTVEAKRDSAGGIVGLVGTTLDLTERRRDEKRIRLMLRELTHRSKNLLAVIQAMARKTASLSGDLESFVSDFSLRLRAIAAAHDLLVSQSWHGADLRELLRASLAATIDPESPQVSLDGEPMLLTPDAAQNLGLAFHELATNASKYGALSVPAGQLAVAWERIPGEVRLRWTETGGPAVIPPERHGFGRVLLERLVGVTLNGSVKLDFRPEGLVCEIRFPESGVAVSPPAAPLTDEAGPAS